ncbi:MAG: DUF255 domain-containing protein, partial [Bacteroidia bacterium]|nr:DUF255 domain-containing protein [Bacteroidia bacterium]
KEGRLIFVDAYTDWCSWCKKMDSDVYTDTAVGKFMNSHFIPVKMDMEQGFGKRLAMKYHVRSFPTFLICNADGKLVYSTNGYSVADKFLEFMKESLDPAKQTIAKGVSNEVELPFPDFYQLQFQPQSLKKSADSITIHHYLDTQTDLFSEVNWAVLYIYPTNEKYNTFFLNNIGKYRELYGDYEPNQKLYTIYYAKLQEAVAAKDEKKLDEITEMIGKYSTENVEREKVFYNILYYSELKDWKKLAEKVNVMIGLSGYEYSKMINEYAGNICRGSDDADLLRTALDWMKNIIKLDPDYPYLFTYAILNLKLKNYDDAEKYANMALEKGKSQNIKTTHTEELIKKIQAARNADK